MTTAKEIEILMQAAQPKNDAIARIFAGVMRDVVHHGMHIAVGRNVGAARARKLRRRGEDVLHVWKTKTGKSRYRWMRKVEPFSIYKP